MTFRQAVYSKLNSMSTVTSIVGSAIYPQVLPETHDLTNAGPALTYSVASDPRGHVLTGPDGTSTATVQISGWASGTNSTASVDAIRQALTALDGVTNDSTWGDGSVTIVSVVQRDESDQPEPPKAGRDEWIRQIVSEFSMQYRI